MNTKKEIAFGLVTIVVIVTAMEVVFRYAINYGNRLGLAEKKAAFEPYREAPWADDFLKNIVQCGEQSRAKDLDQYARFVLYDTNTDCETKYINYADRVRKTWNPDVDHLSGETVVRTVAMFGGSTLEGVGAIDDETIPSQFSKIANGEASESARYLVTNYGASGYTYTQALMKLILLLRDGKRFDYVIFYGGANDIDNAYTDGAAGALFRERDVKARLQGETVVSLQNVLKEQVGNCGICRALVIVSRHTPILRDTVTPVLLRLRDTVQFMKGPSMDSADIPAFSRDIADYYARSHEVLDAISRSYGFSYLEFWQPALHYEEHMTEGERVLLRMDSRLTDNKIREVYRLVRHGVAGMNLANFYDISDVLHSRGKAYYLDAVHISGEANGVVAGAMHRIFAERFLSPTGTSK